MQAFKNVQRQGVTISPEKKKNKIVPRIPLMNIPLSPLAHKPGVHKRSDKKFLSMSVDVSAKDNINDSILKNKIKKQEIPQLSGQKKMEPAMAILGRTSALLKNVMNDHDIPEHHKTMMD